MALKIWTVIYPSITLFQFFFGSFITSTIKVLITAKIFIITIIAIQFSDLLKGISLGMLVAIFYILRTNYRRDYKFHQDSKVDGGLITITLSEHVTFINKGSIANKLSHIKNNANVVIEGKDAHFIDLDVLEILYDFKESAKQKNIQVELKNLPERVKLSGH